MSNPEAPKLSIEQQAYRIHAQTQIDAAEILSRLAQQRSAGLTPEQTLVLLESTLQMAASVLRGGAQLLNTAAEHPVVQTPTEVQSRRKTEAEMRAEDIEINRRRQNEAEEARFQAHLSEVRSGRISTWLPRPSPSRDYER